MKLSNYLPTTILAQQQDALVIFLSSALWKVGAFFALKGRTHSENHVYVIWATTLISAPPNTDKTLGFPDLHLTKHQQKSQLSQQVTNVSTILRGSSRG